jgi:hypothetical protein
VLSLAGIDLSTEDLSLEAWMIRQTTATINPVAVAQFFHQICTGIFNALLGASAGSDQIGILGQISNYFAIVTAPVCSAVMHVAFGHLTSLSWRFLYSRAFAPECLFLL